MNTAMRLNILTGGLATVWMNVCSPQPIFNVFFRNSLGASAFALGALVALIQLSALFQLASIFIYGYSRRRKPAFIAIHLAHRVLTLSIAAAAFYAAATGNRSWGIRAIMITVPLSWIFMNASAAGWWSWVADLFPENIRGSFFLKRSAIINVINVIWFFLASMALDLFEGPGTLWAYGVIFLIGAVSGVADLLLNIFIPEPEPLEVHVFSPRDALEPLKNPNFIRFSVAVGVAIFSINLIAPFQAPFVVDPDRIGAPLTWLGIMFVISQLTWVFTAPFWGAVMDKWGRKPVVVMGCLFTLSWVGYLVLTPRSYVYLLPLISIGTGLLAPAFWEGINQMMLSLSPTRNRIAFVAWFMTIVGVVSSGGSLLGGYLLDRLAGLALPAGPFVFGGFHMVQLFSILMVLLSAYVISRVREGRERPIAFVLGRVANPGILKTYAYLDDIATASDPGRAEQALRSIEAETGDLALDEIVARLDDPYPEIREEAARALGRVGSPLVTDQLVQRLADPASSLRIAAARALGKIRDRRAVAPVIAALQGSASEELQEACVQALGDIGGDAAAAAILDLYRMARSDRLRASAGDAASRLGLFEAAEEIFPRFVAGRSAGIRRQYAIALGNLLGSPGEFYSYVSGSASGIADRTGRLFTQLEQRLRANSLKLGGGSRTKKDKTAPTRSIARLRAVREQFDAGDERAALALLVDYAQSLTAALLGNAAQPAETLALAFRLDQQLGAFAWLLARLDAYLGALPAGDAAPDPDQADAQRLCVLLILYYLESA